MQPPDGVPAFRPPEALSTARLALRKPVAEDAQEIFTAYAGDVARLAELAPS